MSCSDVQIEYTGDGSQVLFTIPFEYERETDVFVGLYNEETHLYDPVSRDDWSFENATTIRFAEAPTGKFKIYRSTEIDYAVFSPGSNIRAQDLNANFDQVSMAIEEGRCADENLYDYIDNNVVQNDRDIVKLQDQLDGNVAVGDTHVFSTAASIERYDVLVSEDPGAYQPSQEGKYWIDTTEERIAYWNADIGAWVDTSQTGAVGPQGPPGDGVIYQGTVDATQPDSAPDTANTGDFYYNTGTGIGDGSWGPAVAGTALSPGHRIIRNDGGTWDVIAPTPTSDEIWTQGVGVITPTDVNNDLEIPGVIETGTGIRFGDGTTQTTAAASTAALWERNGVELSPVTAGDDIRLGDPAGTNILIDENIGYTHECFFIFFHTFFI